MRPALANAQLAMEWLKIALWYELRGSSSDSAARSAKESACRMLEAQAEQAARLGLRGLIDTSVPLTEQVAAEIARGQ